MTEQCIGVIVLAAGCSSRLGHPKQLLRFGDKSLVRHAVARALNVSPKHTVAVLGADSDLVAAELEGLPSILCVNDHWDEGMGSSLKVGMCSLLEADPDLSGVLVTVVDQPFVTSDDLLSLVRVHKRNPTKIVTSAYDGTIGVPTLFPKRLFGDLLSLPSSAGAQKLIIQHSDDLIAVECKNATLDIDTLEDYERLIGLRQDRS